MQRNLRSWNAGEAVFSEGEALKHFWVIKTGTVQVTNSSGVVELGPGDVLGLRAELLNLPSTETAITLTKLVAWELDVEKMVEESGGPDQPLAIILKALMKQDQEENEIGV
jgi:CRP-like cAMP-binding protein